MQRHLLILIVCLAAGCASRGDLGDQNSVPYKSFLANNNANVQRLSIGMAKDDVLALMKSYTTETRDGVVLNPMKTIASTVDGHVYEILYYLTRPHPPFTPIVERQATPVFLKDGRVVGWGQVPPDNFELHADVDLRR